MQWLVPQFDTTTKLNDYVTVLLPLLSLPTFNINKSTSIILYTSIYVILLDIYFYRDARIDLLLYYSRIFLSCFPSNADRHASVTKKIRWKRRGNAMAVANEPLETPSNERRRLSSHCFVAIANCRTYPLKVLTIQSSLLRHRRSTRTHQPLSPALLRSVCVHPSFMPSIHNSILLSLFYRQDPP